MVNGTQVIRQEFERTRMEFFPTRQAPNNIVLARVGAEWLDANINQLLPVSPEHQQLFTPTTGICRTVSVEAPAVCGPFLTYYEQNGIHIDELPYVHPAEQRTRYGAPLTPAMSMIQNGAVIIVQIFERARLEWHPDDAFNKVVKIGRVVAEMVEANQPRPLTPTNPVNQLVDTDIPPLPIEVFGSWRWGMPQHGYWDAYHDDIYVATSTILYLDEFWSVRAPSGYRFVSLTILINNRRDTSGAPLYLDYSYIALIDHTGVRAPAHPLSQRLVLPVNPSRIMPQSQSVGQLVFLLPDDHIPAQLEFNWANLDQYVSRDRQYIELRSYPKS
ncbi:MAG: hypothetical protein ACO3F2_06545 [Roseiflexaceae bacterium]